MSIQKSILTISGLFMLLNGSCMSREPLPKEEEPLADPEITITTVVTGYEIIWGMDFLPGGDMIFGEKRGKL